MDAARDCVCSARESMSRRRRTRAESGVAHLWSVPNGPRRNMAEDVYFGTDMRGERCGRARFSDRPPHRRRQNAKPRAGLRVRHGFVVRDDGKKTRRS
eukprot:scaffold8850_cov134-Isochrysis_galbana.AAC.3